MQANVLIADDHPLFRAAMRQALAGITGESVVEASTFSEARDALIQDDSIELVFLDIHMPGNDGLTGLSELRTTFPDVLVVMVSAEDKPDLIRKAIDLGASGYIPKSTPLPLIAGAVSQVLDGSQWLPDGLEAELASHEDAAQAEFAERLAQLTPHQFTVLKMMADGLLNKQIAWELSISESTVKQHASAVLRKLNVINRTRAGVLFRQLTGAE